MPDINNNGQGNPMNAGYRNTNSDMNSLQSISNNIMEGFQSVKKQFDEIAKALTTQTKENEKLNKLNQNFIRNFTKNGRGDFDKSNRDIQRLLGNIDNELGKYVTASRSGKAKSLEGKLAEVLSKNNKQYFDKLQALKEQISSQKDYLEGLYSGMKAVTSDLENLQKEYDSLRGKTDPESVSKQTELLKKIAEKKDIQKENTDEYEKLFKEFEKLYNQQSTNESRLKETTEFLQRINSNLSEGYSDLASLSPAFSNLLEKQQKVSKKDQYKEAVDKALQIVTESITSLEEKISTLGEDDDEQREILEKQLKNANEQKDYLKNLKPIKDNTRQMWTSLKDVGGAVIKGALTGLKNSLENRYLDTYAEGFQRVYDSVESTRNEISARLRFNQGQFDDMQNNIQAEIKAQGLEGAISLVDVNEAVQGLVAAGITDQETIEKLAFEQAKLKYMGSPFDLQNEGNLSYIMSELNKGTNIDTIVQGFETLSATARTLGEEYGNTMALANGGAQATLSQIFSMGEAAGKSYEQIISDAQDAMTSQMSLASYNVSSDLLTSMLKEIQGQNISSTSPFNQYLLQQGLSADTMKHLSVGEQQDKLVRALQEATDQGGEVPNWLKPLMETWGIGAQYTDIANFLQGAKSKKGIQTSNTPQQQKEIEKLQKEDQEAMQKALYKSQTEKVNTEYENKMTDLAQNAEHFFEGDTIFMSQINNIKNGIDSIIDILATFAWSSITGGARGLFGGGAGGTGGGLLSGTVGQSGQPWGNFGFAKGSTGAQALGYGIGVAQIGYTAFTDIKNADNLEEGIADVFSDPKTYGGVGQVLGTAIAGPVGGAVANAAITGIITPFSKIGEKWYKNITEEKTWEESILDKYQSAAADQLKAASDQLDAAESYKASIDAMSIGQKKYELEKVYGKSYEEVKNLSEDEVDDMLLQLAENDRKIAEAQVQQAEIISGKTDAEAEITSAEKKYNQAKNIYNSTRTGSKQKEQAEKDMQTIKTLSQIDTSSEEWTKTGYEGSSVGLSKAEQYMREILGDQDYFSLLSNVETIKQANEGFSDIDALKAMFPNTSEDNLETLEYGINQMRDRKEEYLKANEAFHNRWKIAESIAIDKDPYGILNAYNNMGVDQMVSDGYGWYPSRLGRSVVDTYWDSSLNMPNLPDGSGGTLSPTYLPQAYAQKFKSGLSRVPYDNYNAVLHEGERILTKREAEVYNNIIPDIVEAATTEQYFRTDRSSSNVMNTNVYGSSDSGLHKDITDQTSSLTDVLNKILEALRSIMVTSSVKSGINRNILAMNSDVVQVNTSR